MIYRWTDAIRYCKKALKLCAQAQPQDLGKLLDCYQKLIESQVKNKSYNDALETFEKIKIYNLNSLNSEDVDFKTLMALEIYKLVNDHVTGRDHRHKAKQLLKGMHPNPDPQNERHMKKFLTIVSELYNCQKNPSHLRYSFLSARKTYQIKHGPVIARDRVAQSFYF